MVVYGLCQLGDHLGDSSEEDPIAGLGSFDSQTDCQVCLASFIEMPPSGYSLHGKVPGCYQENIKKFDDTVKSFVRTPTIRGNILSDERATLVALRG